jgi:hypothetical protein
MQEEQDKQREGERDRAPSKTTDDLPDVPGSEGGSESPASDKPPGAPADDDSPLGDTDQHSQS